MSEVVKLTYFESSIAIVALEDRVNKNTFSKALLQGLMESFQKIQTNQNVKVVIVHGYDNYFCCGGTKDELLSLQAQKATFADSEFYRVFLDCEVPVVAAMQGHALGGGLTLACYADLMVMAEECLYSTNFMKYGFTPGMGATYIVPRKFGELLGHEMLYTAKNYHGGVLKSRGVAAEVVRKFQVIDTAVNLARELADKPVISLKILKQHLVQTIKEALPEIIAQELKMHEITFVQPEVKERIDRGFGN